MSDALTISPELAKAAASTRSEGEVRARRAAIDLVQLIRNDGCCASDAVELLTLNLMLADRKGFMRGFRDAMKEAGEITSAAFAKALNS